MQNIFCNMISVREIYAEIFPFGEKKEEIYAECMQNVCRIHSAGFLEDPHKE